MLQFKPPYILRFPLDYVSDRPNPYICYSHTLLNLFVSLCLIVVIPVIRYRAVCPHTRSLETARRMLSSRNICFTSAGVYGQRRTFWSVHYNNMRLDAYWRIYVYYYYCYYIQNSPPAYISADRLTGVAWTDFFLSILMPIACIIFISYNRIYCIPGK